MDRRRLVTFFSVTSFTYKTTFVENENNNCQCIVVSLVRNPGSQLQKIQKNEKSTSLE